MYVANATLGFNKHPSGVQFPMYKKKLGNNVPFTIPGQYLINKFRIFLNAYISITRKKRIPLAEWLRRIPLAFPV